MQVVIPMTGHGSRFVDAGYGRLKPFIEVHGRPMIEWVVKMFAGVDDEILFVCRQEHLDNLDYVSSELLRISPESRILSIKDWKKHGPAHDVLSICDLLKNEPTLISYCDYYMHWDYGAFKRRWTKMVATEPFLATQVSILICYQPTTSTRHVM